ncbi:MAG: Crp/Fnr family transcriptional regulator [Chloroflexi bacterium]|nr:Crp/Fnr family transcriptional regulator [Chloroflexota bacterium]
MECRRALVEGASVRAFPAGAVACGEGELCDGLFILRAGVAKEVVRAKGADAEAPIDLLRPGDTHGLISLIDGKASSSSLVTVEPCEFLVIPRTNFVQELKDHPRVYRQALDYLCLEVRHGHEWIRSLLQS